MPAPVAGGKVIGYPYQGTHTRGNWQSDNAVDIAVPKGTPVYAVHDGTIGPNIGPFNSLDPTLSGSRLSILWTGNSAYYAHLSKILVKPGQRVKTGDLLGYSGVANGVAHLHWAIEKGSPLDWIKGLSKKIVNAIAGEDAGTRSQLGTGAQEELAKAGCASTLVLLGISIFGSLEIVKILLN